MPGNHQRADHIKIVQCSAGIAVGNPQKVGKRPGFKFDVHAAQAPLLIGQRVFNDCSQIRFRKHLQGNDPAAGQQRCNHLKRRIFGRGTDQGDESAFHMVQKGVLLGLVEAVDLVHEEDGAFAIELLLVPRDLDYAQKKKGISPALKRMLAKARLIIISELRFSLKIEEEEAIRRLDRSLPVVEVPEEV